MKKITLIVALLLLSACSATGSKFSDMQLPDEGKARIYVYRPSAFIGGGMSFSVGVNQENIGRLKSGGYLTKQLSPGDYDVWAKTEAKRSVFLKLEAGDVKCIRGGIDAGFFVGRPSLELVSMDECRREIGFTNNSF